MPHYPAQLKPLNVDEKRDFLNRRYDTGPFSDTNKYYPRLSYQFVPHGSSLFGDNWGIKIPSNSSHDELGAYAPASPPIKISPKGRTVSLAKRGVHSLMSPLHAFGMGKGKGPALGFTVSSPGSGSGSSPIDILNSSPMRVPTVPVPIPIGLSSGGPSSRLLQLTGARQASLSPSQLAATLAAGHSSAPPSRRRSPPKAKKNPPRSTRNPKPKH